MESADSASGGAAKRGKVVHLPGRVLSSQGALVPVDSSEGVPFVDLSDRDQTTQSYWRSLLEQLVIRETGCVELSRAIPQFLAELGANRLRSEQLSELFESFGGLSGVKSVALSEEPISEALLRSCRSFLRWYLQRKKTRESFVSLHSSGAGVTEERDAIFEISVLHDRELQGVSGFEVQAAHAVVDHVGERLRSELRLEVDGQRVMVRPGWESWGVSSSGRREWRGGRLSPFCSVVPFSSERNLFFLDAVRHFVPYAALDLPKGRCAIRTYMTIQDSRGERLARASAETSFRVRDHGSTPIESFRSRGYWPRDPVTETELLSTRVDQFSTALDHSELPFVRVSVDLCYAGSSERPLCLECRLLSKDGEGIRTTNRSLQDSSGDLVRSVRLSPSCALTYFDDVQLEVPLFATDLEDHADSLTVEVLLRAEGGAILCGSRERVALSRKSLELLSFSRKAHQDWTDSWCRSRETVLGESTAKIVDLLVDSSAALGSAPSLRMLGVIHAAVPLRASHRVQCQVRARGGAREVSRLLLLQASEPGEQSFVMNIGYDELVPLFSVPRGEREEFTVTVKVSDSEGKEVHAIEQDTTLLFPRTAPVPLPKPRPPAYLSDVSLSGGLLGGDVQCLLRIDLDCRSKAEGQLTLYAEVFVEESESGDAPQNSLLPGTIVQVDLASELSRFRGERGWVQTTLMCCPEVTLRELRGRPLLKLMLFAQDGRLLQVLRQPLAAEHWDFVAKHQPTESGSANFLAKQLKQNRLWPKLKDFYKNI